MKRFTMIGVAAAMASLVSGCGGPWPFGDICNQEYRLTFAYVLSTADAKVCDATSDGWDDDAWPGFADYHDRQDDVEFDDLYEVIPPAIELLLLGDREMGIGACVDRDILWDVLDWAREEPWIEPTFDEGDLWDAGRDEYQPYWSSDCRDFWKLEFDFRCAQMEEGDLPKSIMVQESDYDWCADRPDLGVDWSNQY